MSDPGRPSAHLFDLTRLVSRVGRGVWTGIDRVEAAYLARLLDDPNPLYGLVGLPGGFVLLDRAGVDGAGRPADRRCALGRGRPARPDASEGECREAGGPGRSRAAGARPQRHTGACPDAGAAPPRGDSLAQRRSQQPAGRGVRRRTRAGRAGRGARSRHHPARLAPVPAARYGRELRGPDAGSLCESRPGDLQFRGDPPGCRAAFLRVRSGARARGRAAGGYATAARSSRRCPPGSILPGLAS